ncbi:MAG: PHP domain-containing protein [Patescibacteria group bacterium]|nr:PHP domain-containing protein [Patescibacteria group bacterium]
MNNERLFMPSVDESEIGAEAQLTKKLPAEEKTKRQERRERPDGLAQYISQWWQGDAHTHSKESTRPGFGYVEAIYDLKEERKYSESLGLEFVCITEHASLPGAPAKQAANSEIGQSLLAEAERIKAINQEQSSQVAMLSGVEANIFYDGAEPALDLPPAILEKLDLVIASRHKIDRSKEPEAVKQTLLFAARQPQVDVIGHPDRNTRINNETSPQYWESYWSIWPEILDEMARNHKAFEINLNAPPSKKLIEMAIKYNLKFFINFDAHDFNQYKKEQTGIIRAGEEAKKRWAEERMQDGDEAILKEYKIDRLSSGPGVVAILRLVRWLKRLERWGVTPDRVVNSSKENLLHFLTEERGKQTENLDFLNS